MMCATLAAGSFSSTRTCGLTPISESKLWSVNATRRLSLKAFLTCKTDALFFKCIRVADTSAAISGQKIYQLMPNSSRAPAGCATCSCRNTRCPSLISCGFFVLDKGFFVSAAISPFATMSWSFILGKFVSLSRHTSAPPPPTPPHPRLVLLIVFCCFCFIPLCQSSAFEDVFTTFQEPRQHPPKPSAA